MVTAGERTVKLPLPDDFRTVSQLLLIGGDDIDGMVWLDDLSLQVATR